MYEENEKSVENTAEDTNEKTNEYRYDRSYYQSNQEGTYYTNSQQTNSTSNAGGNGYQTPKKKYKLPVKGLVIAAVALFLVGIGAGAFYGVSRLIDIRSAKKVDTVLTASKAEPENNNVTTVSNSTTAVVTDVSKVVENAMPCVVSISNVGVQKYTTIFGQTGEIPSESSGSGIIIGQNDEELLIVTNHHVVEGADTLNANFIDGTSATANVKGTDSGHDIAVIAITKSDLKEETLNSIKVATLGDSNNLKVGEPAIAIGNALGYGQSVTVGVISALDREVTVENVMNKLVQTDAAINPGNSGGALMNIAGEVIGINSVKYANMNVEGMGYAIPISDVSSLIDKLMNQETKKKVSEDEQSYMGISCVDVTTDVSQTYNMPKGVYVAQVEKDSPAEKCGLEKGDIITKIAETTVTSFTDLKQELLYHAAGTKVVIEVQRPIEDGYGYKAETVEIELGKKKSSGKSNA